MLKYSTIFFFYLTIHSIAAEAFSAALKRQMLIFYEPPYENYLKSNDQVTEHYITQRLDNFDHQNERTFQMVFTFFNHYFFHSLQIQTNEIFNKHF